MGVDPLRTFGFLLARASRAYVHRFEQRARELGLTLQQCRALVILAKNEGISQAQLADGAEIEPMTLVRILDRMEGDGWVERRNDPADRRARRLHLKPGGRALQEEIWRLADLTRKETFAGMSASEAELLISLLERIIRNLSSLEELPTPAPHVPRKISPSVRARRESGPPKT
jgi:MarR family transcriptional regulator, transcriptional regulator for hemolysin